MKLKPLSINVNPHNVLGYCLLYNVGNYDTSRQIYEWVNRVIPDKSAIGKKNPLETYHITLNYIGPLEQNQLHELDAALDHFHIEPITITLDKVGYFDNAGVMYVGMKGRPPVALQKAFDEVNEILESLGIESEHNRFPTYRPHITVLHDCPSRPTFPVISRKFTLTLLDLTMSQSIDKGDDGKIFVPVRQYPKSWYRYDYYGNEHHVGGFITTAELANNVPFTYISNKLERRVKKMNEVTSKEKVTIYAPPRDRQDGKHIKWKPSTLDEFKLIENYSRDQMRECGMQPWADFVEKDNKLLEVEGNKAHIVDDGFNVLETIDLDAEGDDLSKYVLYLFPKEWYGSIPNGLEVVNINGGREKFEKGKTDPDTRFGALAFGFLLKTTNG